MNMLLVSATSAEIAPFITHLNSSWQQQSDDVFANSRHSLHVLISGVGMVATTYALTKAFQQQSFGIALQAGIAGSFNTNISLGEVVQVTKEMFGDMGAEDHYNFVDIFDLQLANENEFPFYNKKLIAPSDFLHGRQKLKEVSSLTINTVSGSSFTATARFKQFGCDLESMEGAAFHYVCLKENIPFIQVRAISNYVAARDKSKWEIGLAIKNLNDFLVSFADSL